VETRENHHQKGRVIVVASCILRPFKSLSRIVTAVALCVGISACQTAGKTGVVESADKTELRQSAADAIAGDMVSKLTEIVDPGTGTVILKSDGSPFVKALETSLKGWGYAVAASDQKIEEGKSIHLAYTIDDFEGDVLARLSTSAVDIGRAYSVTDAGASPSSPLSVMRRS
jgi:hypothetical protein